MRWVDYEIVEITAKDKDKIFSFLKTHYYPDEPISKALGGVVTDIEIEAKTPQITNGLSRMAIEKKTVSKRKNVGTFILNLLRKKKDMGNNRVSLILAILEFQIDYPRKMVLLGY